MASIQVVDRGRFVHACGGSVIERNLVLTAAHCMKFWQVRPMRIIFGTSYPTLDGPERTERNIANFSTHPLYNTEKGKAYYDVAVVVLDEEVAFSDRIKKVRLPTEATVDGSHRNGHSATLTGWGEYEPKSGGTPELRHTQLEIFAEQYCNKTRFETDSPLVPNLFSSPVFCAGLSFIAYSCKLTFQTFKILTSEIETSRLHFSTSENAIHVQNEISDLEISFFNLEVGFLNLQV